MRRRPLQRVEPISRRARAASALPQFRLLPMLRGMERGIWPNNIESVEFFLRSRVSRTFTSGPVSLKRKDEEKNLRASGCASLTFRHRPLFASPTVQQLAFYQKSLPASQRKPYMSIVDDGPREDLKERLNDVLHGHAWRFPATEIAHTGMLSQKVVKDGCQEFVNDRPLLGHFHAIIEQRVVQNNSTQWSSSPTSWRIFLLSLQRNAKTIRLLRNL